MAKLIRVKISPLLKDRSRPKMNPMTWTIECLKKQIIKGDHPSPPPADQYQQASVFLLVKNLEVPEIIVVLKADNEGYPWRNQIALPGGHVDEGDEDNAAAAYRELSEELHIAPENVDFLGSLGHFQTIKNKDIEVFSGVWNGKDRIKFDPKEIAQVHSLPVSKLLDIHRKGGFSGRKPDLLELRYPFETFEVWGVTAKILHYFLELLLPKIEGYNN